MLDWLFGWLLRIECYFAFYLLWIITGDKVYAEDAVLDMIREVKQDIELEIIREKRQLDAEHSIRQEDNRKS